VTTRALHPNTRALIARLRGSLPDPAPAPAAPAATPAPAAPPPAAPFQLTPWQPKPAYKVKYPKGPQLQGAFAFAAPPPPVAKGKGKSAPPAAVLAPDLSDVIVLDTETTGIGSSARIVEVAALHVKNGAVVRQFQSLVNPEMHIPSMVVKVHGITDAMVVGAPTAAPVLTGFAKFVAGHTLVAHNASFDFGILRGEYGRVKVAPPGCAMYCSVKLARVVFPEAPNHKLGTLATFLKLPHPPTHRALADCFTTMALLNAAAARKKSHQAVRLVGRSYDL
jgi:DNA polymerase-3 subunit epsilon